MRGKAGATSNLCGGGKSTQRTDEQMQGSEEKITRSKKAREIKTKTEEEDLGKRKLECGFPQ